MAKRKKRKRIIPLAPHTPPPSLSSAPCHCRPPHGPPQWTCPTCHKTWGPEVYGGRHRIG